METDADHLGRWLTESADGNHEAFGRLADAMQDELYRLALAGGLPTHEAVEVVQETLHRAWRHRSRYQSNRSASGWLCGICLNVVREFRRKRKRQPSSIDFDTLPFADENNNPIEQQEALLHLAEQLQRLPDRQREILTCRYLRDMSVAETSEAMGIAEGTVKAATAAALANLRTQMGRGFET